jgi:hypothetical protein
MKGRNMNDELASLEAMLTAFDRPLSPSRAAGVVERSSRGGSQRLSLEHEKESVVGFFGMENRQDIHKHEKWEAGFTKFVEWGDWKESPRYGVNHADVDLKRPGPSNLNVIGESMLRVVPSSAGRKPVVVNPSLKLKAQMGNSTSFLSKMLKIINQNRSAYDHANFDEVLDYVVNPYSTKLSYNRRIHMVTGIFEGKYSDHQLSEAAGLMESQVKNLRQRFYLGQI